MNTATIYTNLKMEDVSREVVKRKLEDLARRKNRESLCNNIHLLLLLSTIGTSGPR